MKRKPFEKLVRNPTFTNFDLVTLDEANAAIEQDKEYSKSIYENLQGAYNQILSERDKAIEAGRQKGVNEELAGCARINFENLARAVPGLEKHPFFRIAKLQLDEALGGATVEAALQAVTK